jgi:hypothetical protein
LTCEEIFEKGHVRIESRRYWFETNIDWLEQRAEWKKLTGIGMVESRREINDKTSVERCYYLPSVLAMDSFSRAVRRHWHVENKLHWTLDVAFKEGNCSRPRGSSSREFDCGIQF